MKAIFGVAGDVVPGDLRSLGKRLEAQGSVVGSVRAPGLELLVVGRSAAELEHWQAADGDRMALAVGRPLHPDLSDGREILASTLRDTGPGGAPRTRDWLGEFNLLLLDPAARSLEIETDCLGLRPLFARSAGGRTVFGSEVLPLVEAGLVPSRLDPDAVAAWILLEHPLNGRSLVEGLHRLPAGRTRIDLRSGAMRLEARKWEVADEDMSRAELVHEIGASVDGLLTRVIRDEIRLGSFLSGGFDSRYVACRLSALGHTPDEAILVDAGAGDLEPGIEVAARLDMPLRTVSVPGSLIDAFEDPWYFAPHGFPQRSFYTSLALRGEPHPPPMVDGLLGDDAVRGWVYEQRVRGKSPGDADLSAGLLEAHLSLRPEMVFDEESSRLLRARVRAQIESFRPVGVEPEARRAWLWVLEHRSRDFHAKNHLQVLDRTETYHPFVTPQLIGLRLAHRASLFDRGLYDDLLDAWCPVLQGIPHSEALPRPDLAHDRYSFVMRDRIPGLMAMVARQGGRMGLARARVAPRLAAYGVGDRNQLYVVKPLDRLRVLTARAAAFGAEVPWTEIRRRAA